MFKASGEDIQNACIGGIIMSLATSYSYLFHGKLTGMGGLIPGLVFIDEINRHFKYSIFAGILLASVIIYHWDSTYFQSPNDYTDNLSIFGFATSGLLIGVGTRLANGCTTSHGICGIARFSRRSLVAVIIFVFTAILVCSLLQATEVLKRSGSVDINMEGLRSSIIFLVIIVLLIFLINVLSYYYKMRSHTRFDQCVNGLIVGGVFSTGLIISGLNKRSKVIGFLDLSHGIEEWDPSLIFVFLCSTLPNILLFKVITHFRSNPILDSLYEDPQSHEIDFELIGGSILFGMGWGITGVSPGACFVVLPLLIPAILFVYLPALLLGHSHRYLIDKAKQ